MLHIGGRIVIERLAGTSKTRTASLCAVLRATESRVMSFHHKAQIPYPTGVIWIVSKKHKTRAARFAAELKVHLV